MFSGKNDGRRASGGRKNVPVSAAGPYSAKVDISLKNRSFLSPTPLHDHRYHISPNHGPHSPTHNSDDTHNHIPLLSAGAGST